MYAHMVTSPRIYQVLFKSAKVIPVMCMGKFLNGASFPWSEYAEAMVITSGVTIFSLGQSTKKAGAADTTEFFGLMCLTLYICSDAFTSQWQDKVYKKYKQDSYQMMFGVNCSAIILTIMALVVGNELPALVEFLIRNPKALMYNVVTAITSATGQMFIFYTIKQFGPVVFTIIMTTRQMFSMIISSFLFSHPITLCTCPPPLLSCLSPCP